MDQASAEVREKALALAVQANPNATADQIARDAERFVTFLLGSEGEEDA